MSSIIFHTERDGEAYLWGGERAHMGVLIGDLATAVIPDHADEMVLAAITPKQREYFTQRHFPDGRPYPAEWAPKVNLDRLRTHLRVGMDGEGTFQREGKTLASFSLMLNTVLALGSEPLALMARLHAQCEIHAYVEGPNRAWMADVIERGRATGLYREIGGGGTEARNWEGVVELLRKRADAPVVTSYTVCEGFPGNYLMKDSSWAPQPLPEKGTDEYWEARDEAWGALSEARRWELCMAALRSDDGGLEIKPGMESQRFRHEESFFDLFG